MAYLHRSTYSRQEIYGNEPETEFELRTYGLDAVDSGKLHDALRKIAKAFILDLNESKINRVKP